MKNVEGFFGQTLQKKQRKVTKKGLKRYQNLSEEEKESNNMVTNNIKIFLKKKNKYWLSIWGALRFFILQHSSKKIVKSEPTASKVIILRLQHHQKAKSLFISILNFEQVKKPTKKGLVQKKGK